MLSSQRLKPPDLTEEGGAAWSKLFPKEMQARRGPGSGLLPAFMSLSAEVKGPGPGLEARAVRGRDEPLLLGLLVPGEGTVTTARYPLG